MIYLVHYELKILLKGGTTVSRIAEIALGIPLRISGRITARGTVASLLFGGEVWKLRGDF